MSPFWAEARFVEANDGGRHLITYSYRTSFRNRTLPVFGIKGWRVTYLPVDKEGVIDFERLKNAIADDTSIISVMWANNEIGSLQPVEEIAQVWQ